MTITKPSGQMLGALVSELSGDFPQQRVIGKKVARVTSASATHIPYAGAEQAAFRRTMLIPVSGVAFLTWSIDMSHRGINAGANYDPPLNAAGSGQMPLGSYYPIGISGLVAWRRATTIGGLSGAFSFIGSSTGAGQLSDRKHHYQTIGMARVPFAVEGGYYYQFSLSLSSHTDAGTMNGVDGAAELTTGGGINFLQIEYEPGAVIEA